eukprot:GHVS01090465.1.p2 GENE.GHVS01090465.1~~GHVS01090465.1.p2  ORF type:complete len:113 (+),score=11.29 GHVS01090465.1:962-1300(+)
MADSQILDVDVIAHTRSIFSFPIISKDIQVRASTNSNLGDVRQQVLWLFRRLANATGGVGAHRVEVAQYANAQFWLCLRHILPPCAMCMYTDLCMYTTVVCTLICMYTDIYM